MLSHELLKNG